MSAVAPKKKRERQSASQAPARHSGEDRNPAIVSDGWRWVTLGDVMESMKNGIYKPSSFYAEDGLACLRMYNIEGGQIVWRDIKRMRLSEAEILDYELLPGDILVNRVNSRELVGKAAVVPLGLERCVFESKNIRVRVRRDLAVPEFINYRLLSAGSSYFNQNAQQVVGMASISQPQVARFPVPLPSLAEQRRIVAEIEKQFTRLDAGVAALRRVQANLKRYRAAVLKAACEGRLVPTEAELAKAEGRTYETGEQLLARILADRRKNWHGRGKYKEPVAPDTTNLPLLPEGWTWASLEQVAWSSSYGTSAKCSYDNPGPPVLRIPNIAAGRIDISDLKFAGATLSIGAGDELTPGDLLIIRTNGSKELIGRSAVIRTELGRGTGYASYLIRFRLWRLPTFFDWIGTIWDVSFLRGWIEQRAATSAGQYNISMSVLSTMPILLPSVAEQTRIVAEVERRLSVVEELEATVATNLQRATRFRQSILQRAFISRPNYS
jgi:type I restriction enzyme S subunit